MHQIKNIHFKGYKVFPHDQYAGMENLSRVNVIIGKNNSGKTSLLDIIETVYNNEFSIKPGIDVDEIIVDASIDDDMIRRVFSSYSRIGSMDKQGLTEHVRGQVYPFTLDGNGFESDQEIVHGLGSYIDTPISSALFNKRKNYRFRKITAERNISPELELQEKLSSNGSGASNLIATFLNDSLYDESIIEDTFLNALNRIMQPEAEYVSIRVQQVTYGNQRLWEVFLQEKGFRRVPLSKSGSGLKTIVLVLLNLLVIPHLNAYKGTKLVYGFEELENNLHPALQRRLFEYIYDYAITNDIIVFLTTHSHIAINAFFDKDNASIYHVIKEHGLAVIKRIESYIDKTEILDDLDVKASDILQSNGIIWVEGPSDRIYIKRWLELFTPNEYEEGKHYQFLYYGGRLLSQYTAKEETDLINIITTNRNAAIVIDSDKRSRSTSLNNTKKRIMDEFDHLGMFYWVTKGKEIENYLPKEAVESMLGTSLPNSCDQYQLFPDFISPYYKGFSSKKVPFANKIKGHISSENSADILDLKKQIEKLYTHIKAWNR